MTKRLFLELIQKGLSKTLCPGVDPMKYIRGMFRAVCQGVCPIGNVKESMSGVLSNRVCHDFPRGSLSGSMS